MAPDRAARSTSLTYSRRGRISSPVHEDKPAIVSFTTHSTSARRSSEPKMFGGASIDLAGVSVQPPTTMSSPPSKPLATRPTQASDLKSFDYELVVRQQPKQARLCTGNDKQPKGPIDPPPVVRLQISRSLSPMIHQSPHHNPSKHESPNPRTAPLASPTSTASSVHSTTGNNALCKAEEDEELYLSKDRKTRVVTGNTVSSLYHLRDPKDGKDGASEGFFIFPDIGVRIEGKFRLKMSLYEMVESTVHHCKTVYTEPFAVYSAKKYPGMEDSTELSKSFASQGLKMRIKGGPARHLGKTPADSGHRGSVDSSYSGLRQSFKRQLSPDAPSEERSSKMPGYSGMRSNGPVQHLPPNAAQHQYEAEFHHSIPPPGTSGSSGASPVSSHGSRFRPGSGYSAPPRESHYAPYYDHMATEQQQPHPAYYEHRPMSADFYAHSQPSRSAEPRARYPMHQQPPYAYGTSSRPTTAPAVPSPHVAYRPPQTARSWQHSPVVPHQHEYELTMSGPRPGSSSSNHGAPRAYADYQSPSYPATRYPTYPQHDPHRVSPQHAPAQVSPAQSHSFAYSPSRYTGPLPPTSSGLGRFKLPPLAEMVPGGNGNPSSPQEPPLIPRRPGSPPSGHPLQAGHLPPPLLPSNSSSSLHSLLNPAEPKQDSTTSQARGYPGRRPEYESVRTNLDTQDVRPRPSQDDYSEEDHRYYQNRARYNRRYSGESRTSEGMPSIAE